jgi:heme/copper-type cytochrome/quinol oxidase subunit 1
MDFWTLGLIFLGISTTAGAVNFIVTIFALRAPGMSLNRMPLFVWTMLATAFAILFALPALTLDAALLFLDREFGARFFDPAANGSPLLWQHLFWVFGHPDVYIMFLPAVGIVSSIVPVFSRRPIVAYAWLALAAVATGFIGFGVWVHHMFATGLPVLPLSFFSAASLLIVIPSGIQVFAWIATLWTGRPVLTPALLWVIGFIVIFVMGGVTGVMVASIPFDWQVHDSYFVVAHFHYVLVGSAMFAILGGITYWLPKMSGRLMHDPLNHVSFWTVFAGFNLTFFPMHVAGLLGMPRRVYTYPDGVGLEALNLLETIGAFLLAAGLLMFAVNVIWALIAGERAGANPWGANTLEWATSSPPPPYNFAAIPAVRSADPLWERDQGTDRETLEMREYLETPHAGLREMAATSPLDADPARVLTMPGDSLWPIALAISLATGFVGLLSDVSLVWAIGGVLSLICIAGWAWPEHRRLVE